MCDPMTLAGLAMSTVGGLAKGQTQANYVDAVNAENKRTYQISQKAREDERARQAALEAQGTAAWENTNTAMSRENFDTAQTTAATDFVDTLAAQPTAISADTRLPGQEGASVAVKDAISARVNSEAAKTRERIKAFSELTSFSRAGEGRAQTVGDTGNFLSTLGGIRRGSLAVAGQEQNIAPATVRPGSTLLADLLSGAGGILSYGGSSLFPGTGTGIGVVGKTKGLYGGGK